jgi:hypothetical protein
VELLARATVMGEVVGRLEEMERKWPVAPVSRMAVGVGTENGEEPLSGELSCATVGQIVVKLRGVATLFNKGCPCGQSDVLQGAQ